MSKRDVVTVTVTELAVGDVVLFRPATLHETRAYPWSKYLGKEHVVSEVFLPGMEFKIEDCAEDYFWSLSYVSEVLPAVEFERSDINIDTLFL